MGTVGEWLGNGRGMSQGVAGAAIERPQRGERRIARRAKADGGRLPPAVVHQIEKRACDDAILSKVLDALGRIIEK